MSTIVVTKFVPSEAYQTDPHVIDDGMNLVSRCDGVLANYHGILQEDPNVGFTVQVATSPEAFVAVVSNKELFDTIMEKLSVSRVGEIERRHFIASNDPTPALTAPVTEISYWTLKNSELKEQANALLKPHAESRGEKFTYGWTGEDPNTCIVLAAWDSVEAHLAFTQNAEVTESLAKWGELIDTDVNDGPFRHVKLAKA